MKSIELTYQQVVEDLTALANERPDYVYGHDFEVGDDCTYFNPRSGAPACIIGHVLAKHGITYADTDGDASYDQWNSGTSVSTLAEMNVLKIDGKTHELMLQTQAEQDTDATWSRAVKSGIDAANRYN